MSASDEAVERVAREIAVYLTKRRDVLEAVMAGDARFGADMMRDLAHRVLANHTAAMKEALEECRLIVANLPHSEELLLAKIDAALISS